MFDLLLIVKVNTEIKRIVIPGVTSYKYDPETGLFKIEKDSDRLFVPKDNVVFVGRNSDFIIYE